MSLKPAGQVIADALRAGAPNLAANEDRALALAAMISLKRAGWHLVSDLEMQTEDRSFMDMPHIELRAHLRVDDTILKVEQVISELALRESHSNVLDHHKQSIRYKMVCELARALGWPLR